MSRISVVPPRGGTRFVHAVSSSPSQFAPHAAATLAPPSADTYVASGSANKN